MLRFGEHTLRLDDGVRIGSTVAKPPPLPPRSIGKAACNARLRRAHAASEPLEAPYRPVQIPRGHSRTSVDQIAVGPGCEHLQPRRPDTPAGTPCIDSMSATAFPVCAPRWDRSAIHVSSRRKKLSRLPLLVKIAGSPSSGRTNTPSTL